MALRSFTQRLPQLTERLALNHSIYKSPTMRPCVPRPIRSPVRPIRARQFSFRVPPLKSRRMPNRYPNRSSHAWWENYLGPNLHMAVLIAGLINLLIQERKELHHRRPVTVAQLEAFVKRIPFSLGEIHKGLVQAFAKSMSISLGEIHQGLVRLTEKLKYMNWKVEKMTENVKAMNRKITETIKSEWEKRRKG